MPSHDRISTAVVVTELYPPAVGGSAVLLGQVYARFTSHDVLVLTDGEKSTGATAAAQAVTYAAIDPRLRGIASRRALSQHARLTLTLRRLCRGTRAVVHAGRALPEGIAALGNRVLTGVPYICWCHGEEVATALTSRELTFTMRRVYGGAAAIVANSRHTRDLLMRAGMGVGKIEVVHPGVDADRFRPDVEGAVHMRERLAGGADLVLLSVGRLQRRKGHDLAIEAVAMLARDYPHLKYVIVGDGDERPRLKALCAALGVESAVVFAGELSDGDLPAAYAACDIFLLPNRLDGADLEGFGIVFLEAAAAGKPVIAGTTGGAPEAVSAGETGFLVEGTDVAELAGRIRQLADSRELRASLGGAGRARAAREFTWPRAAAAVMAVHAKAGGVSC
ncbi:MAG: glycosyltransferase family 4 protein [Vicinamibacterales bacterium]